MARTRLASVETLVLLALEGKAGRYWYAGAHRSVREYARLTDQSPRRVADMLALFSPRVNVRRSVRLAHHYLTTGEYARDTMQGVRAAVAHYEDTGEIRGPKTAPFARALVGDGDAIVLDVWMARAFGCDQRLLATKRVRERCESRIRRAADWLGWTPCEVQAAVWTAAVRRSGRRPYGIDIVSAVGLDTLWHQR